MSNSNNNQNKKPKVLDDNDEKQWDAVRRYLEQGPFARDHPGLRAALEGIDRAQAQQRRDRKLHAKFAASSSAQQQPTANSMMATEDDEGDAEDAVKVELPSPENNTNREGATQMEEEEEDDWHNVVASHSHEDDTNAKTDKATGSILAQQAVAEIAQHGVQCATPVAALAVVLHAALLQCGFTCTGVPPTDSANNGFAAPVRDLKEFLPAAWEDASTAVVRLRYRQPDTGALVLTVTAAENAEEDSNSHTTVRVTLAPAAASSNKTNQPEEEQNLLVLNLADHVNLDSWKRATSNKKKKVAPALHYKALATLLTRFAQHFDLGSPVVASSSPNNYTSASMPYVDYTALQQQQQRPTTAGFLNSNNPGRVYHDPIPNHNNGPGILPPGDFSGDLTPTGIHPYIGMGGHLPDRPGNLMGPNHPMFTGVGGVGHGSVPHHPGMGGMPFNTGVGTMTPRFDPFGPPGGPTEQHQPDDPDNLLPHDPLMQTKTKKVPPGGTGVPNNDMAQPPSLPRNDMFS